MKPRRGQPDATPTSRNHSVRVSCWQKSESYSAEQELGVRDPPLILDVDDTEENLEILRVRLEANGYEIVTAADGEEGLARARELAPDLILLDIMMPKRDGISVLREIKQDEALLAIPVILVTAKSVSRHGHTLG